MVYSACIILLFTLSNSCTGNLSAPQPCPSGSANSLTGQKDNSACLVSTIVSSITEFVPTICISVVNFLFQECLPGSYSSQSAATSCLPCPDGFICSNSSTIFPVPCLIGSYSVHNGTLGQASCIDCPLGAQCPFIFANPIPCANGYYANQTRLTACLKCPAGYECPLSSLTPTPCALGTYSFEGSQACTLCPAGFFCPNNMTTVPLPCVDGQFSNSGASKCTFCPIGHFCPDAQLPPIACPAGMYNGIIGQTRCVPCERGRQCLNKIESIPCPPGTYSPELQAGCLSCELGTYSVAESGSCLLCTPGHFCSDPEVGPLQCEPGYIASSGETNCTLCPSGKYIYDLFCNCYYCFCKESYLTKL